MERESIFYPRDPLTYPTRPRNSLPANLFRLEERGEKFRPGANLPLLEYLIKSSNKDLSLSLSGPPRRIETQPCPCFIFTQLSRGYIRYSARVGRFFPRHGISSYSNGGSPNVFALAGSGSGRRWRSKRESERERKGEKRGEFV